MFDVASSEVIVLGVVALLVIPPKDLPRAMRMAGQWVGKVRGVANQFRSGFDTMVREAELQEMEKKWAAENARIMREHPPEPVQMLPMVDTPGTSPRDTAEAAGQGTSAYGESGDSAASHAEQDGADAPVETVAQPKLVASPVIAPPVPRSSETDPKAQS